MKYKDIIRLYEAALLRTIPPYLVIHTGDQASIRVLEYTHVVGTPPVCNIMQ
jgi:hypothetical protein